MKIVYLIYGLYKTGGLERILTHKANYLAEELNHEIHIITRSQCGRSNIFKLSSKVNQYDLNLDYGGVTGRNPFTLVKNATFLIKHYLRLKKLLLIIKPDITISMYGNELIFLPYINDGSKKILEYHFSLYSKFIGKNLNINKLYQKFRIASIKALIRKFDKFVTLTNADREDWGNIHNSISIPNPMTLENPNPNINMISKRVVSTGRLTYQKGYDRLIRVWSLVNKKYPDWELVIYGEGEDRELLQSEINKHNLSDKIILHPVSSDLSEEYKNASFFVSSSRYEGFPLVIFEAMACGLPVVSYNYSCGPSEMIDNYVDGILVENGDEIGLSNSICYLIENYRHREKMSQNAILKAKSYNTPLIMEKWNELFNEIINIK